MAPVPTLNWLSLASAAIDVPAFSHCHGCGLGWVIGKETERILMTNTMRSLTASLALSLPLLGLSACAGPEVASEPPQGEGSTPSASAHNASPSMDGDEVKAAFTQITTHGRKVTCSEGATVIPRETSGEIVELTGDCTEVVIEANGLKLAAEQIGTLRVHGNGNIIALGTVETLELSRDGNMVGFSQPPQTISDTAHGNQYGTDSLANIHLNF
ncbi:hypothetical protein GCM10027417_14760 [Glutamicibacter endophyticus]